MIANRMTAPPIDKKIDVMIAVGYAKFLKSIISTMYIKNIPMRIDIPRSAPDVS